MRQPSSLWKIFLAFILIFQIPLVAGANFTALLLPINNTIIVNTPSSDYFWPGISGALPTGPSALNRSSYDSSSVSVPHIICNRGLYGRNLNIDSCLQPYDTIGWDTTPRVYGERGGGPIEVALPARIQSSEPLPS